MSSSQSDPASACPVDHKSREAWLNAAKQSQPQQQQQPIAPHPVAPGADASACPVDHKSRETWLKAAQQQSSSGSTTLPRPKFTNSRLSTDREVSTIPRGGLTAAAAASTTASSSAASAIDAASLTSPLAAHGSAPSPNSQTSDPHTSASGHWIYPSEEMFFNAMRRKSYNPQAKDMQSIIPIHNAVNERTWHDILAWERAADPGSWSKCGGPKLVSFEGDSSKLTPRARWKSLMGYQAPFDRHDWVVERCGGKKVEYVIDFYQGKAPTSGPAGGIPVSFYLDVRPKLNSLEGARMRFSKYWGLGG